MADIRVLRRMYHYVFLAGFYPHPSVPVCPGVFPVQREVVYCPDLKFIAYDVAIVQGQKPKGWSKYTAMLDCSSKVLQELYSGLMVMR